MKFIYTLEIVLVILQIAFASQDKHENIGFQNFVEDETNKFLVEMDEEAFDLFQAMMRLNRRVDPSDHHRVLKGGRGGSGGGGKAKGKASNDSSNVT